MGFFACFFKSHSKRRFRPPPPNALHSSISSRPPPTLDAFHWNDVDFSSSPKSSSSFADDHFLCQICFVPKPLFTHSFCVNDCIHIYCKQCMSSYIASKLQQSTVVITCPSTDCHATLDPYDCRDILPTNVFQRWGDMLCESTISVSEKLYCPFKDCSALLISGDGDENVITKSKCPHCKRLFCVKCKCSWHTGMVCSKYQKLDDGEKEKGDLMLMNLAENKKWKRCPKCKFFVERSKGCNYIICRCKCAFCYRCGVPYSSHNECQR